VPELIVIVGPIASGKSTIAYELGRRFRTADRSIAVLDLDDVVATIGGFAGLTPARFRQAQLVYGELIAAWLRRRFDVIAHGPFFDHEEDEALLHAVPAAVTPRRVQLLATYEVALERTALDSARALSRDRSFSDSPITASRRFCRLCLAASGPFDTTTRSPQEIVDTVAGALLPERP
jgi:hypothetical protein